MILNSNAVQKMDVSSMHTCILCSGTATFFSKESFIAHNREFHRDNKVVFHKLQELESSKKELTGHLNNIKAELRNLYKRNLAKKETVELVQKEIDSLKRKIKDKDRDIKYFKTILQKERSTSQPEDPKQLVQLFKERMDKEFYCLLDLMSKPSFETNSKSRREVIESSTTEEDLLKRISTLEQKVDQLSALESELAKLKVKISSSKEESNEGLDEKKETIDDLRSLLHEKEREVELVKKLSDKYKESEEMKCKESTIFQERLINTSEIMQDLNNKNKHLFDELSKSLQSLKFAQSVINDLNQEKSKIETKIASHEKKISQQSDEIEFMKTNAVAVDEEGFEEKMKLVQQQLVHANEEIQQKKLIIEEQDQELVKVYNGQTLLEEDIQSLQNEKEELKSLMNDLQREKKEVEQQRIQWQEKLDHLENLNQSLIEEKEMLVFQLKDIEVYKEQRESMIDQLNDRVEELEKEKMDGEKELMRVKAQKDELQRELKDLQKAHSRCRQDQKDMQNSYERSIESLRGQMEQLLKEESETSRHLQLKFEVQEKDFHQQISQLQSEVCSERDQVRSLTMQLGEVKDKHQNEIESNKKLQEKIGQLKADIKMNRETPTYDKHKLIELEEALVVAQNKSTQSVSDKQHLEAEVKDLIQRLSNEQSKFEQVQLKMENIEKKSELKKADHEKFVEELKRKFDVERDGLKDQIENKVQEIKILTKSWEAKLRLPKDSSTFEVKKLNKEIEELKQTLTEECDKVDTLKHQKDESEKEMFDHQQILSQTKADHEQQLTTFKTQIQYLEKELEEKTSSNETQRDELLAKLKTFENDFAVSKKNCSKLSGDNEKLTVDNNSMMLNLFEKKELDKVNKEKIQTLTKKIQDLESQAGKSSEGDIKAAEAKIIELSKELFTFEQLYNDSVVDCDLMSKKMRESEFDLVDCQEEVSKLKEKCEQMEKIANESGVQKEEKIKELKNTKDELTLHIQQVQNLTEVNQQNGSKLEAMQKSFEIAKSSKKEIKEQLDDEKQKNQALQDELELMREAIKKLQNKATMNISKEKQNNDSIAEPQQQQEKKDEKATENYSSSFDDDSSSATSNSSASTEPSATSSKSVVGEDHSKSNQTKENHLPAKRTEEEHKEDDKVLTEEIDDEVSLPLDMTTSEDENEDDRKKSLKQKDDTASTKDDDDSFWENKPTEDKSKEESFGTKLDRKETVVVKFQEASGDKNSTEKAVEFQGGDSDEDSDIPIPKREWGEDYMNGLEQPIEEEFGEVCDESVASLSDESSKKISIKDEGVSAMKGEISSGGILQNGHDEKVEIVSSVKEIPSPSATSYSLSSSDAETSSSRGLKKQKNKMKKKNGGKAKKNKSKESLPPLKAAAGGGLPPLKGKRMFLRGLPLTNNTNKSPEKLGQDELKQNPDSTSNTTGSTLKIKAEIENGFPIERKSSSCSDLIIQVPTIANKSNNNKVIPQSSTSKIDQQHQRSQQTLVAPVKSQKSSSLLGDLPPLPTATSSKSSIVVAKSNKIPDIFGGRGDVYDESEDVEEDDSFGDDDIDALLGGLDQFDAQKKFKQ